MPAATALSGTVYTPRAYTKTPVPTGFERHLMNRMGCGFSPALLGQMRKAGGPLAWFEEQLHPLSVPEASKVADIDSWFPSRHESMETKWNNFEAGRKSGYGYGVDLGNWSMLRRMFSTRTVFENMVDFWSNHFHVPAFVDRAWVARQSFDSTIRAHALGRFDALLEAASLHPAMLIYLDNYRSVRNAPNENQGRELLELHTVGSASGYTEQMVKDSAVILSGWTVHDKTTWQRFYSTANHTIRPVTVLGFSSPNGSADGRAVTSAYLRYLAHHPNTARTVARKLATRFVSDSPSDALVTELAQVFLSSGTDIRATLRALVASDEFRAAAGAKVRTPIDDLVATTRVLRINPLRPAHAESFATQITYVHGTDKLFSWPRPDGAPQTNDVWCSASRMLLSYREHWHLGGGYYPRQDVVYRRPRAWLPQDRLRFDSYVDHLCRVVLGRRSTALILQSACEATLVEPSEIVTRDHPVADWLFVRLIAALLDSPAHMTR